MLPSPYGQMPEMARNSVDFPEPEGPASSALSPWGKRELFGLDDAGAVGQRDVDVLERGARAPPVVALRFGPMVPSTLAFSIASSNEVRRSTTDLKPASEL